MLSASPRKAEGRSAYKVPMLREKTARLKARKEAAKLRRHRSRARLRGLVGGACLPFSASGAGPRRATFPALIVRGLGRLGRLLGQMIRYFSQTTSDRDRACSEAPVDSSGPTRRLRFFGKRPKQTSPYSPDTLRRGQSLPRTLGRPREIVGRYCGKWGAKAASRRARPSRSPGSYKPPIVCPCRA
jgi:hypothetical protein